MLRVFLCSFLFISCSISALSTSVTESLSATPSVNATSTTSTDTPSTSTTTSTTSTTTTTTTTPTQTLDPKTAADFAAITSRRLSTLIEAVTDGKKASGWLSTLNNDTSSPDFGTWPDVDYTTGCAAQRANWPALNHWTRIYTLAGAWRGGVEGADQLAGDATLFAAVSSAVDWWFTRDFTNPACIDSGNKPACPCSEPGMWNTNWYSNIIGVPEKVSQTCLILNETLTESQLSSCVKFGSRSFAKFKEPIVGVSAGLTGANTLDVASIGLNLAFLTQDVTVATEAYQRIHDELQIRDAVKADGIRADGSFGQHGGIIYNGNYGKDYAGDLLDIEREAAETQFAANETSRTAFATYFEGSQWMIYYNSITKIPHWDFSVIGRMVSFPVADDQASASIKLDLDKVKELGEQWNSSVLTNFADSLSTPSKTANAGGLVGHRNFFTNDYAVARGKNYVSTLRLYSSRTVNTECTNSQNPLGFHLADGASHLYLKGDEYEDIAAAQDWYLIPGITVAYGADTLDCSHTGYKGIEKFVGGASTGRTGISAMRYTSPQNASLSFQKAWFFLENDVQHVMVSGVNSATSAPVYSVLDQKRRRGGVYLNGAPLTDTANATTRVNSLWHDQVGYSFDSNQDIALSVQTGNRTGNWSTIGISKEPAPIVDLFTAYLTHTSLDRPISYTVFPAVDFASFQYKSFTNKVKQIQNDASVSAVQDTLHRTVMAVFWDAQGGSIDLPVNIITSGAPRSLCASGNVAVIYNTKTGDVTIADPSQELSSVTITISFGGSIPLLDGPVKSKAFSLPSGGLSGSSVTANIKDFEVSSPGLLRR